MRIRMLLRNPFTRDARVLREARALAAAGHDVTVVAMRAPGLPAVEQRDGFTVERAVRAGALAGPTITGAAGGASSAGARRLPRPAAAVWVRDKMLSRAFSAAATAKPADVYHAHDLNTLEPAVRAAMRQRARLVYDAHELYPDLTGLGRGERARWRRVEERLIGRADVVIVPSEGRADALVQRYGIARPAVVMNAPESAGSPDPAASPLASLRRPGELLAIYAGGFTPNRGLENLVRAIPRAPGWRLVMMGWGPLEAELRRLGGDRVTFVPAVEPDRVVGTIAAADLGIASYVPIGLNNKLAAPNKLFEYLHAGLAIAAADLADIRRIVEGHDVGALFDPGEEASIAAALRSMAEPGRLEAARANARAAAPLYTWEAQAETLLALYEKL